MEQKQFDILIKKAEKRVKQMDKIDKESGFASPDQLSMTSYLRDIGAAIECGIFTSDFDTIAEAYVMLKRLYFQNNEVKK